MLSKLLLLAVLSPLIAPVTAQASVDTEVRLNIAPLECYQEAVNAGSQQLSYLSPEECNELLNPSPALVVRDDQTGITQPPLDVPTAQRQSGNRLGNDQSFDSLAGPTGNSPQSDNNEDSKTAVTSIIGWMKTGEAVLSTITPTASIAVVAIVSFVAADAVMFELAHTRRLLVKAKKPASVIRRTIRRS